MRAASTTTHNHSDATGDHTRLAIAFTITVSVLVVQLVDTVITGSLALLVDAAHVLSTLAARAFTDVVSDLMCAK
jgi:cobalt-zinc-cadmium efflux system protein